VIDHADTEGFGRTAWSPSGAHEDSSGVRRGRSHRAADGELASDDPRTKARSGNLGIDSVKRYTQKPT
jgi:hypothetical protein